eukprot:IDg15907t1
MDIYILHEDVNSYSHCYPSYYIFRGGSRSAQVYIPTDLILLSFFPLPDLSFINRDAVPIANPNSTLRAPLSAVQSSSTESASSLPTAASKFSIAMTAIRESSSQDSLATAPSFSTTATTSAKATASTSATASAVSVASAGLS